MTTPDQLDAETTLRTAAARLDELRTRQALAAAPMSAGELLELLALQEVVARKAGYGRQLTVRAARAAGASWSDIGRAMGSSKQSAWETHNRWLDEQARLHAETGYEGLDEREVAQTRGGLDGAGG